MFDSLATFLVVMLLILWILDALGVLEIFSALLELLSAVVAAVLRLAAWLVRKVAAPRDPGLTPAPFPESPPRGYSARSRGSRRPRSD